MPLRCLHMSGALSPKLMFIGFSSCKSLLFRTEGLSAEQRNLYFFAHGSDTPGIEGMIHSRFLAPATIADGLLATILRRLHGTTMLRSYRP